MAFPTTGLLDDFNRADGALGANWSQPVAVAMPDTVVIVSNQADTTTNRGSAYWNVETFGPDSEVYVTTPLWDTTAIFLNMVSVGASADGYEVRGRFSPALTNVYRMDSTVLTQLGADIAFTGANGDSFGADNVAGSISAYYKRGGTWNTLGSRSDSTYGAGYIGMEVIEPTFGALDDFSGGTVSASSAGGLAWITA